MAIIRDGPHSTHPIHLYAHFLHRTRLELTPEIIYAFRRSIPHCNQRNHPTLRAIPLYSSTAVRRRCLRTVIISRYTFVLDRGRVRSLNRIGDVRRARTYVSRINIIALRGNNIVWKSAAVSRVRREARRGARAV